MPKKILFAVLSLAFMFYGASFALADGIIPPATGQVVNYSNGTTNCPGGNPTNCGLYTVDDFIVLAINISKWILGIVGSLSLVMFIYGGILFLISAGGADRVKKAKNIIVAAVTGLFIVFASFLIIKYVMSTLGLSWNGVVAPPARIIPVPVTPNQ